MYEVAGVKGKLSPTLLCETTVSTSRECGLPASNCEDTGHLMPSHPSKLTCLPPGSPQGIDCAAPRSSLRCPTLADTMPPCYLSRLPGSAAPRTHQTTPGLEQAKWD